MLKKSPRFLRKTFRNFEVKQICISFAIALISLRYFIKDLGAMEDSVNSGVPPMDEFYSTRILRPEFSLRPLGSYLIPNPDGSSIEPNPISLGELLHVFAFHLFHREVVTSYFVTSLLILTLWIYLFSKLLYRDHQSSLVRWSTLLLLLFAFFSNFSLTGGSYQFQRIISPQLAVILWLLANILLLRMITSMPYSSQTLNNLSFALLILVSSFTYTFVFLALLCVWLLILINYVFEKRIKDLLILLVAGLVGIGPVLAFALARSNAEGFIDASLRMGLIESRVPGAFKVISISILILLGCTILYKRGIRSRQEAIFLKFLTLSTLSLLLASQSNVFTGISIQFSDHFDIFAYCNLIAFTYYLTYKLRLRIRYEWATRLKILSSLFLLILGTFSLVDTSRELGQVGNSKTWQNAQKVILENITGYGNAIIDSSILSESFPLYSMKPILFHRDAFYYGISNSELALRNYVSKGCDSSWDVNENLELFVYLFVAQQQKAERIQYALSKFGLSEEFEFLYSTLIEQGQVRREMLLTEVSSTIADVRKIDCARLARQLGVRYVVFTEDSNWVEVLRDNDRRTFQVFGKSHYLVDLYGVQ